MNKWNSDLKQIIYILIKKLTGLGGKKETESWQNPRLPGRHSGSVASAWYRRPRRSTSRSRYGGRDEHGADGLGGVKAPLFEAGFFLRHLGGSGWDPSNGDREYPPGGGVQATPKNRDQKNGLFGSCR